MARKISLDEVNISAEVFEAWQVIGERIALFLASAGANVDNIPDERVRIEDDGSLTVWVEINLSSGSKFEPSLKVPPSEWHWRVNSN